MTGEGHPPPLAAVSGNRVLIVGGYGNDGQRIARLLADDLGDRLLIGGRRLRNAARFAATLLSGATARRVDINDPASYASALEGVSAVIMCLDTTELAFPHACVTRAVRYIDISASYEVIERLDFLQDLAGAHRATIICSVGLAPGLSNLLAKACVRSTDESVASVDVHLLFGLGDRHGKAALEWLVDRLYRRFAVGPRDARHEAWPFEEHARAQFPPPFGERATYRFDFSDQHTLPQTLGVPCVSTWVTYDRERLARWISRLARLGVLRWARCRPVCRIAVFLLSRSRAGSDRFAVAVEVATPGEPHANSATATGIGEPDATAVMAAETLRRVLADPPAGGVFQLDELYGLADFDETLAINGIEIRAPATVQQRNEAQADPGMSHFDASPGIKGARR